MVTQGEIFTACKDELSAVGWNVFIKAKALSSVPVLMRCSRRLSDAQSSRPAPEILKASTQRMHPAGIWGWRTHFPSISLQFFQAGSCWSC